MNHDPRAQQWILVLHRRQLHLQPLILRLRAGQALDHLVEALIKAHELERPAVLAQGRGLHAARHPVSDPGG